MDKIKVLFLPIEIVERELDAKLLLAHEALKRGYTVCLGYFVKLVKYAERLGFGYYMCHAQTDFRAETLFQPLSLAGVKNGALDEEGLVFPSSDFYIKRRIGEGRSLKFLESVFTWGDRQRQAIQERFPEHASRVLTVGNPRIDLLRLPYREIFRREADRIVGKLGNFILVNTNFGAWNLSPSFGMTFTKQLEHYGIVKTEAEIAESERRVAYYRDLFSDYVEMIKKLAPIVYPVNIVLRPHPAENDERWREALKGIPNVRVVFKGNVVNWLQAASVMIHTGCTTGIEAFVLDKVVLRYNRRYDASLESELSNSLGEGFSSLEPLFARVVELIGGSPKAVDVEEQRRHLSTWIKNAVGEFSVPQIMDQIDKSPVEGEDRGGVLQLGPVAPGVLVATLKSRVKEMIRRNFVLASLFYGKEKAEKLRKKHRVFTGIKAARLRNMMKSYIALQKTNDPMRVAVKEINANIFVLTRK